MTRQYRMKVRAERHADTRRRILEAALQLNRTLGPHRVTISGIARLSGVERPTVLRHFRDRISLFMACTSGDPVPVADSSGWANEPDPEKRLSRALSEQYAWFRRNRRVISYLLDLVEEDASLAPWRELMWQTRNLAHRILAEGWAVPESVRSRLDLALRHALSFWAWRSLEESGLSDQEAAQLMVDLVRSIASERS
jgi:AcrR family transcriptional regulator